MIWARVILESLTFSEHDSKNDSKSLCYKMSLCFRSRMFDMCTHETQVKYKYK
jgi:hypothetical protein